MQWFQLLTILTLTMTAASARGDLRGHCEKRFADYGSGASEDVIEADCVAWSFEQANRNAIRNANEGGFKGLGFDNFLVVEKTDGEKLFFAGASTLLSEVGAIRFLEAKNYVYVLSSIQGKVYAYDLSIPGNVGPRLILSLNELIGATDLDISQDGSEVYILHQQAGELYVLDGTRNAKGRESEREMKMIRTLRLPKAGIVSFAHDREKKTFYFLTQEGEVFDTTGKKMEVPLATKQAETLEWNSQESVLEGRIQSELVFRLGR